MRQGFWRRAGGALWCVLLILTAAAGPAGAAADTEAGPGGRTVLHGYENTKWGVTGPDGQVISGVTPEMSAAASAAAAAKGIRVRINGLEVEFPDQAPVIAAGRVLVPMRPVFEHIFVQCRVSWDGAGQQAKVYDQKGREVVFRPGEKDYTVIESDGARRSYPLDAPAEIRAGRILLPLRALLETFSYKVDWLGDLRLADIQDTYPGWRQLMKPEEWRRLMAAGGDSDTEAGANAVEVAVEGATVVAGDRAGADTAPEPGAGVGADAMVDPGASSEVGSDAGSGAGADAGADVGADADTTAGSDAGAAPDPGDCPVCPLLGGAR